MSRPIVLCVLLVGCGFKSEPAGTGPTGPSDANLDGSTITPGMDAGTGDGSSGGGTTDCLTRWLNGTVKLETPQALTNQSSTTADERDPWVSSDGLNLYYTFAPSGGSTGADIYRATRGATSAVFPAGVRLTNLDTNNDESRGSLSDDGKTLVLASNRTGGTFQIYYATRNTTTMDFPSADTRHVATINAIAGNHYDPFLSRDGLELYFAPTPGDQHIYHATRTDPNGDFGAATAVPVINSTVAGEADADPAMSLDKHILLFSSTRVVAGDPKGGNLWYATRQDVTGNFDPPKLVPDVNSDNPDGDPMLSADGCTLYFAATKGTGTTYDIYSAAVETTTDSLGK
ncbi:MAG TPA: hypothetical protein VH165_11945 [Kofleriaceae bacterium]|nr:hypothetical protein [Kofleriaceae bacterium]